MAYQPRFGIPIVCPEGRLGPEMLLPNPELLNAISEFIEYKGHETTALISGPLVLRQRFATREVWPFFSCNALAFRITIQQPG
jgi:molybdopterin-guanine dinucleotide biosynthesis protein A